MTDAQKNLLLNRCKDQEISSSESQESDSNQNDIDDPTKSILENKRPILVCFLGMCSDETEIYIQNFTRHAYS